MKDFLGSNQFSNATATPATATPPAATSVIATATTKSHTKFTFVASLLWVTFASFNLLKLWNCQLLSKSFTYVATYSNNLCVHVCVCMCKGSCALANLVLSFS